MASTRPLILSVTAALAAIAALAPAALANTGASTLPSSGSQATSLSAKEGQPNAFVSVSGNLLGFIVDRAPDGRIVMADHYSHSSHSSHASHYSSRY